jgi:hypothetical protein
MRAAMGDRPVAALLALCCLTLLSRLVPALARMARKKYALSKFDTFTIRVRNERLDAVLEDEEDVTTLSEGLETACWKVGQYTQYL